jgi:hypothetical protein
MSFKSWCCKQLNKTNPTNRDIIKLLISKIFILPEKLVRLIQYQIITTLIVFITGLFITKGEILPIFVNSTSPYIKSEILLHFLKVAITSCLIGGIFILTMLILFSLTYIIIVYILFPLYLISTLKIKSFLDKEAFN